MGTSAEPRVRVILGTVPEISFSASNDGVNDDWVSNLMIPAHVETGEYDIRVEVHLNNRLFTPLNKKIGVHRAETMSVDSEQPELEQPELEQPELEPSMPVQSSQPAQSELPQIKIPSSPVLVPVPSRSIPKPSIFRAITRTEEVKAPKDSAKLSVLETLATKKPKRRFEALDSGMPKGSTKASKPVSIKMSDIDAVSAAVSSVVIEACKPVKVSKKAVKNSNKVKLVKEALFYE
jgi:hypothetical protein